MIFNFSQLRSIVVFVTPSDTVTSKKSESERMSIVADGFESYNPVLFRRLGGIDGLNDIFDKFFEVALKKPSIQEIYHVSPDDVIAVANLRRKYVYLLGHLMGGNNDWHGGTIAEIHHVKRKCRI